MTPTIKELVELNHFDARLIAQLRANAKRRCQLMQQGGRELVAARYAHSAGEPMVMKGPSYLTGQGRVGATTGFGNADLFVGADNVHPTSDGQRAIARVQATLLRQTLATMI